MVRAAEQKHYAHSLSVDEEDDEDAFAREQLRKAVRRQHLASDKAATAAALAADAVQEDAALYGGPGAAAAGAAAVGAAAGGAARLLGGLGRSKQEAIASLAQGVLQSLQDGVARLAASHKASHVCAT